MCVDVALCVHVVLVVCCGVVWCCGVVCGTAWCAENPSTPPRAHVRHASVCSFKTPPCVPARRPHVEHMRASCRCTRRRFETTHGSVLDMSTVGPLSPLLLFFSRPFSSFVVSALLFSSPLFSSLLSPTNTVLSTEQRTRRPTLRRLNVMWRTVGSLKRIARNVSTSLPPSIHPPSLPSPPSLPLSPRKKHYVCNFKKMSRERINPHHGFN